MIIFLIILAAGLYAAQRLSLQFALKGITYDVAFSQPLVDPGEEFAITTTVENNKALPVTFLSVEEKLPAQIALPGLQDQLYSSRDCALFTTSFYLMPRQQYQRQLTASLPVRGRYLLQGCTMHGGDFLGISETVEYYSLHREIVVMPAPAKSPSLGEALGGFLGDISVNRFIVEDPVLTIGFREYTGREPQKSISWVQSARFNRLMVKNYDHTMDLSVTVVLNVEFYSDLAAQDQDLEQIHSQVEDCFSLARSACEFLEVKGIKYSFLTNATTAGALGHWSSVGEGLGNSHFYSILEGLGRATYSYSCPFSHTVEQAIRSAEQGRCHIVITPQEQPWQSCLYRLRELTNGQVCILTPQLLHQGEGFAPAQEGGPLS